MQGSSRSVRYSHPQMPRHMCIAALLLVLGQALGTSARSWTPPKYKRIGYYTNWAQYRAGTRQFLPEKLDSTLFTHIIYAFAKVDENNTVQPYEWNDQKGGNDQIETGLYYRFHSTVRARNPKVKTLIGIGGWNFGMTLISAIAASKERRTAFINSAISYARTWGFDGIDLDFEYPAYLPQGGIPEDKANFVDLLKELRTAVEHEAILTKKPPLLLASAVAAGPSTIANGYNISEWNNALDWIGVMTYDFHGPWEKATGMHTQLNLPPNEPNGVSIVSVIDQWVRGGLQRSKCVFGLAAYGRSWTLNSPYSSGIGAVAAGPGTPGTWSQTGGTLFQYEINAEKGKVTFDPKTASVYKVFNTTQWVGYDNPSTIKIKSKWAKKQRLAGYMLWAIDLDDASQIAKAARSVFC